VELLKAEFGSGHHIHLYTHEPNPEKLVRLARAGLDEFRLHIPHYLWGSLESHGSAYRDVLTAAPSWGIRRGVEIPVLPEKEKELRRLLRSLDRLHLDFINLNEMEFSATNESALHGRGYRVDAWNGWGVKGSRSTAEKLVREMRLATPLHYCSSRFKDSVQLRKRLLRRAERTAPAFADQTEDGTLLLGIVEAVDDMQLPRVVEAIGSVGHVPAGDYRVDAARRRVELAPDQLRRFARRLRFPAFAVEVYPTEDALEVERTPLNSAAFPSSRG